ncbi:MAG: hypothetical protein Q9216_003035 [Gyalolechia sp. 2 TL-2023]
MIQVPMAPMAPMPPPPPPPPQAPHPGGLHGIQSLPVNFERLNVQEMPPHVGHQRMSPPSMGGFGDPGHEFDTSLLRKEKDTYEGYNFERIAPQQPNEKATWSLVTKTKMPLSQSELLAMVNKQKRKGPSAWQLLKSDEMKGFKRKQVDQLIDDRTRADPRFGYELAGLKLDQYSDKRGTRGTSAFQVILRRHLRKDLASDGPAGLRRLQEPHREIVDLTGMSEDPSEGSGQGFFGGNSPPRHNFPPPPNHGFPEHPDFRPPVHPQPFVPHPGPPMHEAQHEIHHGSAPPPHMPPFEGPFIHQDPLPVHPPPPFMPNMPPHMPYHHEHHEKHREKPQEAKQMKQKKTSRDSKPMIHQVKPQKSEREHKRVPSESDWDYLSESSDFSQAYTDETPGTAYSSNSSRKDKRDHRRGKDSRRSSRSHHDDYGNDRHEEVYRVHRRKTAISPDRSRPSGRSRHEIEEIEVIPASHSRSHRSYPGRPQVEEIEVVPGSNSRSHRPYLTRSHTSAHRSERLPEHFDRPAFHSRHMSSDDARHHVLGGLTPSGRRASVYVPKRPMALDLYDAREEQEKIEREEIRRELLREERRKEELRESVARQMERQTEGMRRPIGRERGLSNDGFYEDRPGRYSRGYDNERFMW